MRSTEELFEEFHAEIFKQTSRGCAGADFTRANEIYKEYLANQHSAHWTLRLSAWLKNIIRLGSRQ